MPTRPQDLALTRHDLRRWLEQHWRLSLVEGLVLLALGALALLVPGIAAFAIEAFVGWLFVIAGLAGLLTSWSMRAATGAVWSFGSAALSVACGGVLLWYPLGGVLTLTALLAGFLCLEAGLSLMLARASRRAGAGRASWLVASAVIDLVLAGIILAGLPASAGWAVGLIVGCNLLCGGAALVGMAIHARRRATVGPSPPAARAAADLAA
jgi:uncharacterized membrane protein HdeD (DUF308 family)